MELPRSWSDPAILPWLSSHSVPLSAARIILKSKVKIGDRIPFSLGTAAVGLLLLPARLWATLYPAEHANPSS